MFQILGLARALEAAHNRPNGASYRHGDLKPENILCFQNGRTIGTLKIGDWGEAKEHGEVTEMRPSKTTAKYGTRLYEAPEVEMGVKPKYLDQSPKRRSRLYDIWAMGCITLEFTIWLLKGYEGLTRFRQDLGDGSFYEISIENGKKVAHVHSTAISWMDKMEEDPRCRAGSTAIGDLLELVRIALLVVKLPRRLGTNLSDKSERHRTDSGVSGPRLEASGSLANGTPFDDGGVTDVPPAVGVPSLSITPAEAEPQRIPLQPEPEAPGPARCLTTDFRSRMEGILAEDRDGDEGYWLTSWVQPLEFRPALDTAVPPSPTTDVYSGEIFQSSSSEEIQPVTRGLVAPAQRRVS
jgi:serine/threonine protein kinase